MNKKISNRVNKILSFKKNVSIGFFVAFLAVFLSAGIVKADTTYKWVNNGDVSKSDSRATGNCSAKKQVTTYTCNSSTKGNKLYDGTNKGSSYGDIGHAWPIYEGENTSTATEYTYDGCSQTVHNTSGTVNEWECKSSDTTTTTSSSYSYTATTKDATSPTSVSATLNGTVNPGGEKVHYIFSYRKESESASNTKYVPSGYGTVESGTSNVSVSTDLSGLSSGTKYVYRLYVLNSSYKNSTYGDSKSFTTSGSFSSVSSSSSSVKQYTLKVNVTGAGQIKGFLGNNGEKVIDCKKVIDGNKLVLDKGNKTCTAKINSGESISLSITNSSTQYEFATWAGDCRGAVGTCQFTIKNNKTVSATFNKKAGSSENTATVSVRKTGKGVGKIVSLNSKGGSMTGINCGNDCSENFKQYCETEVEGSRKCGMVYFKATAEKGSTFGGWGGDCLTFSGKKDQCYVILDGAKTINASFNEGKNNEEGKYYDLTVTVSEGGTVATTDSKISCDSSNSPCKHSYGKNGTVTLKLTPNSGYTLSSTGGCNSDKTKNSDGSHTCKVKITSNQKLSVSFKASGTTSSSSSSSKTSSSSASANHTATTGSVTNIKSTSATLNGTVNSKGENVYYIFSYSKKGVSGTNKTTGWKSAGSGSSDVSVSADISGLSSGTTYYYWLSAYSYTTKAYVNSLNGDNGAAKTFTTSGGSTNSSSSSSSSSSASADGLTINKSGSGSGKVIIKTSSGAELQTCDFTGSSSSCNYNPSATDSVFLYATVNSGSSFGGITNCSGGSNLTSDHTSGHCGVLMNNKSTVTVTFN